MPDISAKRNTWNKCKNNDGKDSFFQKRTACEFTDDRNKRQFVTNSERFGQNWAKSKTKQNAEKIKEKVYFKDAASRKNKTAFKMQ